MADSFLCPVSPRPQWAALLFLIALCGGACAKADGQSPKPSTDVDSHLAAAQDAQNRKDFTIAEREYREAIRLSPRLPQAYLNLGLIFQLQDRRPEAMEMFQRALRLDPRLVGAHFFLGVDYCREGAADRALPHLKTAVKEKPDLAEAWSWLATAQQMTGGITEQVSTLQEAVKLHPQDVDLLYLLGRAYEQLGKQAVDRLQTQDPRSAYVEQLLAESYASSQYYSMALFHLQNALAAAPDSPGLHVAAGEIYLHAGNVSRATEEIAAELRLDPNNLRGIVRRGEARLLEGQIEEGLQDWAHALSIDTLRVEAILGLREFGFGGTAQEHLPDSLREKLMKLRPQLAERLAPEAQLGRAFIASQAGSESEGDLPPLAGPAERSALDCTPASLRKWLNEDRLEEVAVCGPRVLNQASPVDLRFEVVRTLYETERLGDAVDLLNSFADAGPQKQAVNYWKARCFKKLALATYLKLAQTAPESYRTHELLGDTYAARGDDTKAADEYRAALAEKPGLPNLHYEIGHLLWKGFKVAEARQEFQAELAANPRHRGAQFDLGNTYLYEHQPVKALKYLQEAARLDSADPEVHQYLGMAYSQLQEYQKAETELKIAVAHDREGKVHYQLGKVYQAMGRRQDAAREFAASANLSQDSHRKNEERTKRLAEAEAVLKQP